MIIFPAIDIKNNQCVRLIKGDFDKITSYKDEPIQQAKKYIENGFTNIHIVDLDGALEGKTINSSTIKKIINKYKIKIQLGGGIRSMKDIESWVNTGVDKVIMGTAAVENINLLKNACQKFKNKIAVSLDVKNSFIA